MSKIILNDMKWVSKFDYLSEVSHFYWPPTKYKLHKIYLYKYKCIK